MEKPYHIVVADDDDDDQLIIKEAIKEISGRNIHVTSVYDGLQLLDCLNKKGLFTQHIGNPDLILLDINMPLMNGLVALEKVKSLNNFKDIPVVMLSTLRTIEREDKSAELGALNFYTKPNNISGYREIVENVLTETMFSEDQLSA